MKNLSINKIDNNNSNEVIGNMNEDTINYLINLFGEIPFVVNNIEQIALNDPIFNKKTISSEHPIAKVLPWLPRFTPKIEMNKTSNEEINSINTEEFRTESKVFYPTNNYKITYLDESLNKNSNEENINESSEFNIIYNQNKNISSNNQYLNSNFYSTRQKSLEEILPQYNTSFNNFLSSNNIQTNINYSLESKIRSSNSTYYIPSKKLYSRMNYF